MLTRRVLTSRLGMRWQTLCRSRNDVASRLLISNLSPALPVEVVCGVSLVFSMA
ncbi:hypothetical protein D3C79_1009340 [compost metagenome]